MKLELVPRSLWINLRNQLQFLPSLSPRLHTLSLAFFVDLFYLIFNWPSRAFVLRSTINDLRLPALRTVRLSVTPQMELVDFPHDLPYPLHFELFLMAHAELVDVTLKLPSFKLASPFQGPAFIQRVPRKLRHSMQNYG